MLPRRSNPDRLRKIRRVKFCLNIAWLIEPIAAPEVFTASGHIMFCPLRKPASLNQPGIQTGEAKILLDGELNSK
jgi:hypothetical protein